jgi:hypothetical protein
VAKTEVLPIGKAEYREQLKTTRAPRPGAKQILDRVHINGDADAVRILGAWDRYSNEIHAL